MPETDVTIQGYLWRSDMVASHIGHSIGNQRVIVVGIDGNGGVAVVAILGYVYCKLRAEEV
jgi:hypothetical protein